MYIMSKYFFLRISRSPKRALLTVRAGGGTEWEENKIMAQDKIVAQEKIMAQDKIMAQNKTMAHECKGSK